MNIYFLIFMKI